MGGDCRELGVNCGENGAECCDNLDCINIGEYVTDKRCQNQSGTPLVDPSLSLNDSLFYIFSALLLIFVAVNATWCCMLMASRRNNKSYDAVQVHDDEDRNDDQKELL